MVVKLKLVELIKMLCIFNPNKAWLKKYSLKKYRRKQKQMSKMSDSESEPDFSNSSLTFASIFSKSKSESDSESDLNSVFIKLGICVFLFYIYTLLNKLVDDFFLSIVKTESIVRQTIQV